MEKGSVEELAPVRKAVRVAASPEVAFARFTRELGTWWPLATHSVFGADAAVTFEEREGGRIVERSAAGEESLWGTVTAWDPPRRVAFTWHPGREPDSAQEVAVTFEAEEGGGTEVTLVHDGWASLGAGAAETRRSYDSGWEIVLGEYRASL